MVAVLDASPEDCTEVSRRLKSTRLQHALRVVHVTQPEGLHLRTCSAIVSAVGHHRAEVTVQKGSQSVSADSILGLLSLAAVAGMELVLSATGAEAQAALNAVAGVLGDDLPS